METPELGKALGVVEPLRRLGQVDDDLDGPVGEQPFARMVGVEATVVRQQLDERVERRRGTVEVQLHAPRIPRSERRGGKWVESPASRGGLAGSDCLSSGYVSQDPDMTVMFERAPFRDTLEPTAAPCLVVFYGDDLGRRFSLQPGEVTLGRATSADLHVGQDSISRAHARLSFDGHHTTVSDLGSTNGTWVNDRRVDAVVLADGDWLQVGQTIFKYLAGTDVEHRYHEELYRLKTVDGLTQVANQRHLLDTLERELNRARRYERSLSLVMFDIDHFKQINDTHGHLAGDSVLRELARQVLGRLRSDDLVARYGGEEFVAVLPETGREGARQVSESIRDLVESHTFVYDGLAIPVTISLGVATHGEGEDYVTVDAFVGAADARLYESKQAGRNRTTF